MVLYHFLADAVVLLHATYIAVVVCGLLAILAGAALGWRWVRNFWFRAVHLLMIVVVVVEALLHITCPLTTLENHLREQAGEATYQGSFIGHWAHQIIFYQGPSWVFTIGYCAFGLAVLAAFILAPPHRPLRFLRRGGG